MESLQTCLKASGRWPGQVADQFSVVQVSFEEDEFGLAQGTVQLWVGVAHPAEENGIPELDQISDLFFTFPYFQATPRPVWESATSSNSAKWKTVRMELSENTSHLRKR